MEFAWRFLDSMRHFFDTKETPKAVHHMLPPSDNDVDVFANNELCGLCLVTEQSHCFDVMLHQKDSYRRIPEKLWYKKALANMENYSEQCFKWAVTRALNPTKVNTQWITKELSEQAKQYD